MSRNSASLVNGSSIGEPAHGSAGAQSSGVLIVNADDWGRNSETTERTLECILQGAVSSVSAMVFMEDSERAADIARERGVDTGLHLNFTTPFSATKVPARLMEYQQRLAEYLRRHRLAQAVFHPGLIGCFEYVVAAQREEYLRLYQREAGRIDGHHHMHLCSNVLLGRLLPAGTTVRRNFSAQRGEKALVNRFYRQVVDRALARRHSLTDFFFSLPPLDPPGRLRTILSLAKESIVEVETHAINPEEYRFLTGGEIFRWAAGVPVAPRYLTAGDWSADTGR
jgi:chitin disaccharide deacetylase